MYVHTCPKANPKAKLGLVDAHPDNSVIGIEIVVDLQKLCVLLLPIEMGIGFE